MMMPPQVSKGAQESKENQRVHTSHDIMNDSSMSQQEDVLGVTGQEQKTP